ncbi:SMI1/KNR4 family protein [Niallia sp. 01092]|uniref:SMI1/KNR4 family protein n=1 Tax=unclassified Niallia TaxID=2837522 RepID=UPI003FCFA37C
MFDKANKEEIKNIEIQIGMSLPISYKNVVQQFSKRVHFYWAVSEENALNINNRLISSGSFLDGPLWDVDQLIMLNEMRRDNEGLDEDQALDHWKYSFIFSRHGNGNYFAIDLKYHPGEVIYLASDGMMHGLRLGESFESFMDNWIRIGCAGHWGEDFELFSDDYVYLDHTSLNSLLCKKWLGLIYFS